MTFEDGKREWGSRPASDYLDPESGALLYADTVQTTIYPEAGEASVVLGRWPTTRERLDRETVANPERSRREAERRARTRVRRYCAANRLTRLWTLTYAKQTADREQVVADVQAFIRRLRAALGDKSFAYVVVLERHESGCFHVHMPLGFYYPKEAMRKVWKHGHVDARKIKAKAELGGRGAARRAASYVAKYIGKTFDEDDAGKHRYEVGQDHQPTAVKARFATMAEGRKLVDTVMLSGGDSIVHVWRSREDPYWAGPPVDVYFA